MLEFFFDFIPQILFFTSVFGYLIFMIIFKWIHAWGDNPPNLLNIMINLYKKPEKDGLLFESADYQLTIQMRILCKEFGNF